MGLVAVYVISWMMVLRAPLSVEYEGPCLWAAVELAHGRNIYDAARLTQPPWAVMIYTPLYFLVSAPFQFLGDYNYWGMRLISMLSYVATMLCSYKLFQFYTKDKLNIFIALVAFSSFVATWSWAYKARVDMLSVALSVGSIYFFVTAYKSNEGVSKNYLLSLVPSILCLVAAVYTKQPSIVVLPAVCLSMMLERRWRDMIFYGVVFVAVCGALALILQQMTAGGFLLHMTVGSKMPFAMSDLNKHLSWLGADWAKLYLLPVLFGVWLFKGQDRKRAILPGALTLISLVLTIYTIGTMYANLNHAFLFFFGMCWLFVIFLEALPVAGGTALVLSSALSTYIIAGCIGSLAMVCGKMDETIKQLREQPVKGKVIFVEDPVLATVCGATPLFVDVATFIQVWARNADPRPLGHINSALSSKEYPVAVINQVDSTKVDKDVPSYFWSDETLDALKNSYGKAGPVTGNGEPQFLYLPKP